ncbi:hypothetical protein ACROSR_16685, partial [Roseovarius tibetensis]|uniref:hypothetical protein n=1 Tax=Roseovarius tibetensis TaxID=2685897 RepID=UPI003D7FB5F0
PHRRTASLEFPAVKLKPDALQTPLTVYLPIFERIEREIAALEVKGDAISRARAVAARHKAVS